jgi:curli biogenesis system outer membrane secretion channel CsgG
MIQQSNCFLVVERGVGMQNLMQERGLAKSGELREGSNMGGGQMVTADYVLTPSVVFSQDDAGGVAGGIGGMFGTAGRVFGAVAGGLQFKTTCSARRSATSGSSPSRPIRRTRWGRSPRARS